MRPWVKKGPGLRCAVFVIENSDTSPRVGKSRVLWSLFDTAPLTVALGGFAKQSRDTSEELT